MRSRLVVRVIGYFALAVAVLVVAGVHVLLFTGAGASWIADQATARVAELSLHYERGTLAGGVELTNVAWRSPGLVVTSRDVVLKADLPLLVSGKVGIADISLESLDVRYEDDAGQSGAAAPPGPSSPVDVPFDIEIRHASADGALVQVNGATPLVFRRIDARVGIGGEDLSLDDVQVDHAAGSVSGAYHLVMNAPYAFESHFEISDMPTGLSRITGSATGDKDRIKVDARLASPDKVNLSGRIDLGGEARFDASVDLASFDLSSLTGQSVVLKDGELKAAGTFTDFRYETHAVVSNPWVDGVTAAASGKFADAMLTISNARFESAGNVVHGNATFDFNRNALVADVAGEIAGRELGGSIDALVPAWSLVTGHGYLAIRDNRLDFSSDRPGHVDLDMQAPHPGVVFADVKGNFSASGAIDFGAEDYRVSLSGKDVGYRDQSADKLKATLAHSPGVIGMTMDVTRWRAGASSMGSVQAEYRGATFDEGDVTVAWLHPEAQLRLMSHARLVSGRVIGEVRSADIETQGRTWTMAGPVAYSADANSADIADHCWQDGTASVCLSGIHFGDDKLRIGVKAQEVSYADLSTPMLGASIELELGEHAAYRVVADGDVDTSAGVALHGLHATVQGAGEAFDYAANAALANPLIEDAKIAASGKGTASRITFDSVNVSAPELSIVATGRYDIQADRLVTRLTGDIHKHPVEGAADVAKLATDPRGTARIVVSDNTLDVRLSGKNRISGDLAAHQLSAIDPGWQGMVDAHGEFDRDKSTFAATVKSTAVSFAGYGVSGLEGSLAGSGDQVDVKMTVSGSRYGEQPLGGGKLSFSGQPDSGTLAVSLDLPVGRFELGGRAGYRDGRVEGEIKEGQLDAAAGAWKLQAPFLFSAAGNNINVAAHCWGNGDGHVCLDATYTDGHGAWKLDVAGVPVKVSKPWYAPDVDIDATLNAKLSGSIQSSSGGPVFNVDFDMAMPDTRLNYFDGEALVMNVEARAKVQDNVLTGTLGGKSAHGDVFSLNLDAPDVRNMRAVRGAARLDTNDLGALVAFIPQLDRGKGALSAQATFDTVKDPIESNLTVNVSDDASVDVPLAGITLGQLALSARGDANTISVVASAASGEGKLSVEGTVDALFSSRRSATFALKGSRFSMLQRSDMTLVASPDITVSADNEGKVKLAGKLVVDAGTFKMKDGEAQVRRPASDVVVVSSGNTNTAQGNLSLDLDVTVKQFAVDMYGLDAGVQGDVELTQEALTPRRAQGTLNLVNGTFSRYGQKFNIDRGRLIFSGPLDNPLVDVTSSRTITQGSDTVKVTLELSGPATNIKSTITSDPPMSGASALSYLVLGHGLDSATSAEGQSLSGAALALGLKQALPITQQIKSALGLSSLTVAGSGVDSTSVIAGKRVGPDLYIEYNYDVFSRIGGILFSYQLTPRLSVETRSGEAKSMKLLYSF